MDFIYVTLTSVLSVVSLFVIAKIMGHKQIAELDFFDYISGITIGSIAAELATDFETPWKSALALVIYGCTSVMLNKLTHKFPKRENTSTARRQYSLTAASFTEKT